MPNIGVKHYFKPTNKLKPYTTLNIAKPILKAKLESGDAKLDKEVEDGVKNIKIWAGELGFGTEYFFDDNICRLIINVKPELKMNKFFAADCFNVQPCYCKYFYCAFVLIT